MHCSLLFRGFNIDICYKKRGKCRCSVTLMLSKHLCQGELLSVTSWGWLMHTAFNRLLQLSALLCYYCNFQKLIIRKSWPFYTAIGHMYRGERVESYKHFPVRCGQMILYIVVCFKHTPALRCTELPWVSLDSNFK